MYVLSDASTLFLDTLFQSNSTVTSHWGGAKNVTPVAAQTVFLPRLGAKRRRGRWAVGGSGTHFHTLRQRAQLGHGTASSEFILPYCCNKQRGGFIVCFWESNKILTNIFLDTKVNCLSCN